MFRSQLESHMTTKMHEQLLRYKQLAEHGTNMIDRGKEEEDAVEKKVVPPPPLPQDTLDELLLRLAFDCEYRQKVKKFLDILGC